MKLHPLLPAALLAALLLPARAADQATVVEEPLPAGVTLRRNLPYDDGPLRTLDLYLPTGRLTAPRPVILCLHGGGWHGGDKADERERALRFVAQGYVAACANYRLSPDCGFPGQIEDVKSVVRWLRSNATRLGLDPEHIGVIGPDAGGHLAVLLGAMNSCLLYESGGSLDQPSHVAAVCALSAPSDLAKLYASAQAAGTTTAADIIMLLGGPPAQVPVPTNASNPLLFADAQTPPMLLIHGDQDPLVPLEQARLLYDGLVAKNLGVHLHVIHGAGHAGAAFEAPDIHALEDAYFAKTLRPQGPPPNAPDATLSESTAKP